MTQPIAGVVPFQSGEVPSMTIWPSIAAYPSGRFLGRLYEIRWPDLYIFRLGNLLALASIPHAVLLYAWRILPWVGTRYTLTNRRILVQRGLLATLEKALELDRFDTLEVEVAPGQAWFHAGNLVFRRNGVEVFRLEGVSRPAVFRRVCLQARAAFVGVRQAMAV